MSLRWVMWLVMWVAFSISILYTGSKSGQFVAFIVMVIIISLWCLITIAYGYGVHQTIRQAQKQQPIIQTKKSHAAPGDMADFLHKEGFERIGEWFYPHNKRRAWTYKNTDGTIFANVTKDPTKAILFSSYFNDHTIVETSFPVGEWVDAPSYSSRFTDNSLKATFWLHQDTLKAKPNQPLSLTNMDDLLKWDKIYRDNYLPFKYKRIKTIANLRSLFAASLFLFWVSFLLVFWYYPRNFLISYLIIGNVILYALNIIPGWVIMHRRSTELDDIQIFWSPPFMIREQEY